MVEDAMAEVREVDVLDRPREVREVIVERQRGGMGITAALLMFILGAIALAVVVLMLLDVHWTVSWPAGHVDIGLKPPVATAATTAGPNGTY
jgi:hypothetical protein